MPTEEREPTYNLNDPEDLARFHLNLLCGELGMTMWDYSNRFGHDKCEPKVLAAFAELATALKRLNQASAPKAVTNG